MRHTLIGRLSVMPASPNLASLVQRNQDGTVRRARLVEAEGRMVAEPYPEGYVIVTLPVPPPE